MTRVCSHWKAILICWIKLSPVFTVINNGKGVCIELQKNILALWLENKIFRFVIRDYFDFGNAKLSVTFGRIYFPFTRFFLFITYRCTLTKWLVVIINLTAMSLYTTSAGKKTPNKTNVLQYILELFELSICFTFFNSKWLHYVKWIRFAEQGFQSYSQMVNGFFAFC